MAVFNVTWLKPTTESLVFSDISVTFWKLGNKAVYFNYAKSFLMVTCEDWRLFPKNAKETEETQRNAGSYIEIINPEFPNPGISTIFT